MENLEHIKAVPNGDLDRRFCELSGADIKDIIIGNCEILAKYYYNDIKEVIKDHDEVSSLISNKCVASILNNSDNAISQIVLLAHCSHTLLLTMLAAMDNVLFQIQLIDELDFNEE